MNHGGGPLQANWGIILRKDQRGARCVSKQKKERTPVGIYGCTLKNVAEKLTGRGP